MIKKDTFIVNLESRKVTLHHAITLPSCPAALNFIPNNKSKVYTSVFEKTQSGNVGGVKFNSMSM